jgi:hypothetical protein
MPPDIDHLILGSLLDSPSFLPVPVANTATDSFYHNSKKSYYPRIGGSSKIIAFQAARWAGLFRSQSCITMNPRIRR